MNQQILEISKRYLSKHQADPRPGETIKVYQKVKDGEKERIQTFEGVVIARKHGKGISATFTLRKKSLAGVGVEKTFPLHLPTIIKIERLKKAKVRRAKLYYLRNIKSLLIKLKGEKIDKKVWEDKSAEEELDKIRHEQELEAKVKKKEKKLEEKALEKKFEEAQKTRQEEV